jgi:hypothetical protein
MKKNAIDRILRRNRRHPFLDLALAAVLVVGFVVATFGVAFQVTDPGTLAPSVATKSAPAEDGVAPGAMSMSPVHRIALR